MGCEVFIRRNVRNAPPLFSFSATDPSVVMPYIFEKSGRNWQLKLLTSGTLTFFQDLNADLFAVGGGGGGGWGGGGGGYTATVTNKSYAARTILSVVVGAGGAGHINTTVGTGDPGGASSVSLGGTADISAAGGSGGGNGNSYALAKGGAGGSGGGGGSIYGGGRGGENGGSGTLYDAQNTGAIGGAGQGTTTRAFGESDGELFSGGGGGGSGRTPDRPGGAGGGGAGGFNANGYNGTPNTGGGGGGGNGSQYKGGNGGSGIVIIRNARS